MSEKVHPVIEANINTDKTSPDFGRFKEGFAREVAYELDKDAFIYEIDPTDPEITGSTAKDILLEEYVDGSTETAYGANDMPIISNPDEKRGLSLEIKLGRRFDRGAKYPATFDEGLKFVKAYDSIDQESRQMQASTASGEAEDGIEQDKAARRRGLARLALKLFSSKENNQ